MGQIKGPFPIAIALSKNDLLFEIRLISGIARFQIQRQSEGMLGGIEHHIAVLNRNPFEVEAGPVDRWVLAVIAKALRGGVEIKRYCITVGRSVLQLLP